MKKLITSISTVVFMGLISISLSHSQGANDEMKMDSKDMNGMEMAGKDGVMNKLEMKKMNAIMKDCMQVHKNEKLCNQNMIENCQKRLKKKNCQKILTKTKIIKNI